MTSPGLPNIVQNPYATGQTLANLHMVRDTYQESYVAPCDLSGIQIAYLNTVSTWDSNGNPLGEMKQIGNPISIRATVWVGGNCYPVSFPSGSVLNLQNQESGLSNIVPVTISSGTLYSVRTEVSVQSTGQSWPLNDLYSSNAGSGTTNNSDVVLTSPYVMFQRPSPLGYGPTAIFGKVVNPKASKLLLDHAAMLVGDSILQGPSATPRFTAPSYGFRVASSAHVPVINFARGGEGLVNFSDPVGGAGRRPFMRTAPTLFLEYGVNDIYLHNRTLAEMEANFWTVVHAFRAAGGKRLITVSLTPIDSTVLPNQHNPVTRYQWREFLAGLTCDSVDMDYIFVDVGPTVEQVKDSDLWWRPAGSITSPYTDDGIHPNANGKNRIVGVVGATLANAFTEPYSTISSLRVGAAQVAPGGATSMVIAFTCAVQRAGTVTLSCDDPWVSLPKTISISPGQSGASVPVSVAKGAAPATVHVTVHFRNQDAVTEFSVG